MGDQAETQYLSDDELADAIDAIYAREAMRQQQAALDRAARLQQERAEAEKAIAAHVAQLQLMQAERARERKRRRKEEATAAHAARRKPEALAQVQARQWRQEADAEPAQGRQKQQQTAPGRIASKEPERLEEADRRLAERWAPPEPLPPRTPEEIRQRFSRRRMPYGVTPREPERTVAEQLAALAKDNGAEVERQAARQTLAQVAAERQAKVLAKG